MARTGDTRYRPLVVGVNHKSAALGLRDRLFVDDDDLPAVLTRLKEAGLAQALFLSTCDRVEAQAMVGDVAEAVHRITALMAANAAMPAIDLEGKLYIHTGEEAVRHIFSVAASLDSLVVGEPQVLGQVKAATKVARDHDLIGPELDRLMQAALHTAKTIRSETAIGQRPVSISAAAAQVATDIHGDLSRVEGLIIGAGDMAELIAIDLVKGGLSSLTATHPRKGRALMTAKSLDCHLADFSDLANQMAKADIVITSLGRRERLLTTDMVRAALKARRYKPLYIIDVAIPGDVDPAINRLDDAFLYDLSELEQVAMEGMASRTREADRAWDILESAVTSFWRGQAERSAVPLVSDLRQSFEAMGQAALIEAQGDADKAVRLLLKRLLHQPTSVLKDLAGETGVTACSAAEWSLTEQVLRRLFDLSLSDFTNNNTKGEDDVH